LVVKLDGVSISDSLECVIILVNLSYNLTNNYYTMSEKNNKIHGNLISDKSSTWQTSIA